MVSKPTINRWSDWAARAGLATVFIGYALLGLSGIPRLLPVDKAFHKGLMLAASIANIMFVSLIASTAVDQTGADRKGQGN